MPSLPEERAFIAAVRYPVVMGVPLSCELAPVLSLELLGRGRMARVGAGNR